MRHIEKNLNLVSIRNLLSTSSFINDIHKSVTKSKGHYVSSRYGHRLIKEELVRLYNEKCCYCEVKIRPAAPEEIEHYRPKAKISKINSKGYYWLGNEWSNLLLVCPNCNMKKSTKFPLWLEQNRVQTHPINSKGQIDYTKIPISSGYLSKERPLLINPEYHFPENLLFHDYTCRLIPINNNILAKTTIKEIDLNNPYLVLKKQEIVNNLIYRIEDQLYKRFNMSPSVSEEQFIVDLNLIFSEIVNRTHPSYEFSLLGLNMVERFDELILEDIPFPMDEIVRKSFIDFLKNF